MLHFSNLLAIANCGPISLGPMNTWQVFFDNGFAKQLTEKWRLFERKFHRVRGENIVSSANTIPFEYDFHLKLLCRKG